MMVLAHPRELDKARRAQPAGRGDRRGARRSAHADLTKEHEQLAAALEAARKKHPDDLGLAICEALRAISSDDPAVRRRPFPGSCSSSRRRRSSRSSRRASQCAAASGGRAADSRSGWWPAPAGTRRTTRSTPSSPTSWPPARSRRPAARPTTRFYLAMIREQGELRSGRGDRRAADGRLEPDARPRRQPSAEQDQEAEPTAPAGDQRPEPATAPATRSPPRREPARWHRSSDGVPVRLASFQAPGPAPSSAQEQAKPATAAGRGQSDRRSRHRRTDSGGRPGQPGAARRPAGKAARGQAQAGRVRSIELADPDARSIRAGDADRAAGRRARPAGAFACGPFTTRSAPARRLCPQHPTTSRMVVRSRAGRR